MRASQLLRFVAIATITAAIVAAIPAAARAQTITACSANKSGSMYRVGVTGAPADRTNTSHKKETWNVQGPQGEPGLSGYYVVKSGGVGTTPLGTLSLVSFCPTGKTPLSGGFTASTADYRLKQSKPYSDDGGATYDGWSVNVENTSSVNGLTVWVWVICAKVAP